MQLAHYLQNLIELPEYQLSEAEQKTIKFEGIAKFIWAKLNSAKFKASSMPPELAMKVQIAIANSVAENKPINLTIPFGGFKKWQLPSYPLPDWAEVFNALLLREYVLPIAAAYPPGVTLQYFSDEIFIARMNNYDQADLDAYNDQFAEILNWLSKYLPRNVSYKFSRIRDQISQTEILRRFDTAIVKLKADWPNLPIEERMNRIAKTKRNYKPSPDFAKLSPAQQEQLLLESTLVHDAFIYSDWEQGVPWAFGQDMIPIGFMYTKAWGIHLKSSRSSTVQFWVGIGALRPNREEYIPTILTHEQYLTHQAKLVYAPLKIFPASFANLQQIPVLSEIRIPPRQD